MQRERRRDPYPWTWEIPVAVALATLFVIVGGPSGKMEEFRVTFYECP